MLKILKEWLKVSARRDDAGPTTPTFNAMEFTGSGAGIMLALAAVLWLVYLVPSWFRRREYLATERNAVRLQQSLRILAETAEVPSVVRTESTARSIAAQERAIRQLEKRRRFEEKRLAAEAKSRMAAAARSSRATAIPEPVAPRWDAAAVAAARDAAPGATAHAASARGATAPAVTAPAVPATVSPVRAARLRRSRLLAASMLLAGVASMLVLGGVVATSGASLAVSAGIAAGGTVSVLAFTLLNRLAAASRSLARPASGFRRTRAEIADFEFESEDREWTPVPLPKPLYMSKPVVAPPVMADPREDERRAAAVDAGEVTPILAAVDDGADTPTAAPSVFAAMGRVDLAGAAAPDLEAAIRRRLNRAV